MKKWYLALCLALVFCLMLAVSAQASEVDASSGVPSGTGTEQTQPEGPALSKETAYIFVGRTSTLKATPSTGVKWRSTNTAIARVDASGKITGVRAGQCEVIARLPNGGATACTVIVRKPATRVTVDKASVTLNTGSTRQIRATVYPADATSPALKYASSNSSVATVDENGLITAVKKGTANITVTAPGGVTATVKVNVRVAPTGVTLNMEKTSLNTGRTKTLKATVSPKNAYSSQVTWKSSNTKVATVNAYGVVTGKGPGECEITATTVNGISASCTVTVRVAVTKVSVSPGKTTLYKGGNGKQLTAAVSPSNATNKTITWASSNTKVATVDENGFVTPVGKGTATITATSSNKIQGKCTVTVRVKPEGVALNVESAYVNKGKTKTLTATVSPSNAYDRTVTWKSSNTKVATVNAGGVVTGKSEGECVITATTVNGLTASCTVYVRIGVDSVKVSPASATINKGNTKRLTATVSPSNASNMAVTWKSSNEKVATVDENGLVTAVGKGTATITATTASNKRTASCKITVRIAPESVALNKTQLSLYTGKTTTLKATVYPSNAYNLTVTWKSSNTKVATVNAYGQVKGIRAGECDITATAAGGKVLAVAHVRVKVAVTSVNISKSSLTLVLGGEGHALSVTINPSNATDKTLAWSSSNESVARVDENGYVTAVSAGTATITAASGNGKTDTVSVKVVEPAKSIQISQSELSLSCGKNTVLKATVGPANAGDKTVTWKSSDKNVAVVTAEGKVFAKSAGVCTITAIANGGVDLQAQCQVTVTGTPTKFVALTFDGGPNKGYTTSILNTLDTYGVRATFFMLGSNVDKNPDLARRVQQAGHEIGNHSYTHPRLTDLSAYQARLELQKTDQAVYKATGVYPTVIRPPYGAVNRSVAALDKRAFVNWNVVSHDATYSDAVKIANITLNSTGYHNCAIILCHDTNEPTAQATKTIVPALLSRGYTFVTVSEMMEICGYEPGDSVVFSPALK